MNTSRPVITGRKGVIAAGHYLATSAGLKMFAKGGNAIDAGVAAGLALTVLKPNQNSLGGECPILVYSPVEKKVVSISGQGTAPGKATVQWFKDNGIEVIPGDGFLGAAVPGLFGAYCTALMKYGRLTLKDVMEPAIDLAENGFPLHRGLRDCILFEEKKFREHWTTTADTFIPGGRVQELGEAVKQPALGKTLRKLVQSEEAFRDKGREAAIQAAVDCFYKGEIAEEILRFSKNTPSMDLTGKKHTVLLEMEDFIKYQTRIEEPVYTDYKNCRVFKCGPWTQGPVFLQQLKLLEGFDLKGLEHNSHKYIHTLVECAKLAFADREKYYGDPDFCNVPMDLLLSEEYNKKQRNRVDMGKANNNRLWEEINNNGSDINIGDTTHLDVVDDEGYMISATPSGGWIQGSPLIPALGFPLGTRVQVFNLKEGHPNCLEPGKRPRTTLTPSMAFMDSKPWMAFGTPGGDMQDQWTLQFLLNFVEFGMSLQQAVDAPSFHTTHFVNSFYPHNEGDGTVFIEQGIDYDILLKLQDMGHKIRLLPRDNNGEVCGVAINHKTGFIEGAASKKEEGQAYAMGW